jgi:hypothetical protein
MKKLLFLLLFMPGIANAQEFTNNSKSIIGVFEVKDKTKSQIFSSINKWIAINYNSSKNVVQMSDLESGTIIVKGINDIQQKSYGNILYPNMKNIPEYVTVNYNHMIEINIKDNKYRIIYTLINIASEKNYGFDDLNFKIVNFKELDNTAITEIIDLTDSNLKKGKIGEEKRELVKVAIKQSIVELNSNLEKDIKTTILNIEKSVTTVSKDGW